MDFNALKNNANFALLMLKRQVTACKYRRLNSFTKFVDDP